MLLEAQGLKADISRLSGKVSIYCKIIIKSQKPPRTGLMKRFEKIKQLGLSENDLKLKCISPLAFG